MSTEDDSYESDRLCARLDVDAVLSEDFDCLALFGAQLIIMNAQKDIVSYVALSDLLQTFLSKDRTELVHKCCLMGTDYNLGVKGIGPKTIMKIDADTAQQQAHKCLSMQSIDIDSIEQFFRVNR